MKFNKVKNRTHQFFDLVPKIRAGSMKIQRNELQSTRFARIQCSTSKSGCARRFSINHQMHKTQFNFNKTKSNDREKGRSESSCVFWNIKIFIFFWTFSGISKKVIRIIYLAENQIQFCFSFHFKWYNCSGKYWIRKKQSQRKKNTFDLDQRANCLNTKQFSIHRHFRQFNKRYIKKKEKRKKIVQIIELLSSVAAGIWYFK